MRFLAENEQISYYMYLPRKLSLPFPYISQIMLAKVYSRQHFQINILKAVKGTLSKGIEENMIAEEVKTILSYEVASGSDIRPCIKIFKPLVVYRFLVTL